MADRTHTVDGTNGPVGFSNYSRQEFINTLEYLVLKVGYDQRLKEIVTSEGYEVLSANYDSDGVVTTATVKWPDGSAGTFTTVTKNATFLTIDAFTISHTDSGKTVTQALVTRNVSGQLTVKPALTVA